MKEKGQECKQEVATTTHAITIVQNRTSNAHIRFKNRIARFYCIDCIERYDAAAMHETS